MSKLIKPEGYKALLDMRQTEMGIKMIKEFFQQNLATELRLRLATEYLRVVAEAAFHYAAIGELEETQQQRVPAIHERHELIVVYLHHVVAAQLR